MIQALLLAAALAMLVGLYSFLVYAPGLALLPARPVARRRLAPDERPRLTLCFCAYREEHVLPLKLDNLRLLRARHPDLEILAYVDASPDRTAVLLQAAPELVTVMVGEERRGKSFGMNRLVAAATGDIVVFTDANVLLKDDALDVIVEHFADPEVGCVCGRLLYIDNHNPAAHLNSLMWRLEERIKRAETRTGSVIGADGSLFAIRRTLHRPPPADIIDDFYVSLSILLDGHRVVSAPDAIAYENSVHDPYEEMQRKIRIACQAWNVHRLLWPRLRRLDGVHLYKYVAHKLLRWFSPFALALSVVLLSAALFLALPLALFLSLLAAGPLALALGHWLRLGPVEATHSIVLSLLGVGIGITRSLRGERFQTWTPAISARHRLERPRLVYFSHDRNDANVWQRCHDFAALGFELTNVSWHRDKTSPDGERPWHEIDLGRTMDAAYWHRAWSVARGAIVVLCHFQQIRGADLLVARNFEPSVLAMLARRLFNRKVPFAYECLDIHRFLTSRAGLGKACRLAERRVLDTADLLIVSSPDFVSRYFGPVHGYDGPVYLLENKMPRFLAQRFAAPTMLRRPHAGPPWRIGWFGMLRDMESLGLLLRIAAMKPELVEVSIRGYPTEITEEELRRIVEPYPNVTYGGPYQKATELSSIYADVDLVWGIDLYDTGVNSDWLLPNRLYEAGFFGRPVIARADTAIGRFVADLQMGCVLAPPYDVACLELLGQLSGDHYAAIVRWMEELPRRRFVLDEELREMTQNLLSPPPVAVVVGLRDRKVA